MDQLLFWLYPLLVMGSLCGLSAALRLGGLVDRGWLGPAARLAQRNVVRLGRCWLEDRLLDGVELLARQPLRQRVTAQAVLLSAPVLCACVVETEQLLAAEAVVVRQRRVIEANALC